MDQAGLVSASERIPAERKTHSLRSARERRVLLKEENLHPQSLQASTHSVHRDRVSFEIAPGHAHFYPSSGDSCNLATDVCFSQASSFTFSHPRCESGTSPRLTDSISLGRRWRNRSPLSAGCNRNASSLIRSRRRAR